MVDVAVASQLQQWTFEKTNISTRPERSNSTSSAGSPNLCDDAHDTLRIDTSVAEDSSPEVKQRKKSIVFQERYMSSEEDLSPADDGSESEYDYDDVSIHDEGKECRARTMSISRWDKGKSCDMAVMVSYAFVGRPKVVELDHRSQTDCTMVQQRSASLASLPVAVVSKLQTVEAAQRMSMNILSPRRLPSSPPLSTTCTDIPTIDIDSRRPSTGHSPIAQSPEARPVTDSASTISSRSSTPSYIEGPALTRPVTSTSSYAAPLSKRSSAYAPSNPRIELTRTQTSQPSFRSPQRSAPPLPSPASHAFLSSDPYGTSTANSASSMVKPAAHKRLRSISMKLALAKIAITPSKKLQEARNSKIPTTPITPYTPTTPQTAPIEGSMSFASPGKLRRASTILRPKSRHGESLRGPSPDTVPPVPTINISNAPTRPSRMVARGASEIEPTLIIPPCPSDAEDDAMNAFKSRKLKKRKSLMSLMDSL